MKKLITLFLVSFSFFAFSQATSGPEYIKAQLTASGVYNTPGYEFTTAYDSYNTSTVNGTIKGMFLHGLPYSKAGNGNDETKVFCWYGEPDGLQENEKVPAVILVHGGGGEASTGWVDEWVKRGYIAISMSLLGNTPDSELSDYSGPSQEFFFSDNDEDLQDQWFYHAIGTNMMLNSLLRDSDFTTHVDTDHIGITGISWGGINNTVLAGLDERLDFVIPVYGCAYLTDSPIYSTQFARMSNTAKAFYTANWEPALYLPRHTAPMLFVDGNKDLQFTMNIFSRTYESSASPEKYLRIEDAMGHGGGPGRKPQDIYDFADYVTGFNSSAVKPLTFTSETKDENGLITYEYSYEGEVDEAILYYSLDTLEWGRDDPDYIWSTKTADLIAGVNGGSVTVTLPEDAQVYYLNINNSDDASINTSAMRYNDAVIDYTWYNYGTNELNTTVTRTMGGVLTENVTSPNATGINTSAEVGQFQIESGINSRVEFGLTQNITDIDAFVQKVNVYLGADINNVSNAKIRIYLLNDEVGYGTSVFKDFTLTTGNSWTECDFDFTDVEIPTAVSDAGGFDRVAIMFAPGDTETSGTVYYFDNLRGTIPQPLYVAPEVFYDWFDYGANSTVTNIDYSSQVGGVFDEIYETDLDGVLSSGSESGEASKFTKIAGHYLFAQTRYDFEDGAIEDSESITFKLKALFKPEKITEINVLDDDTRAVRIFLRDNNGGTGKGQLSSSIAYFTQTNAWETLEFTFESEELMYYDRLMIMVMQAYTNPIDEDGEEVDEDVTYYFESLTANENIGVVTALENDVETKNESVVYPNPANDVVYLLNSMGAQFTVYNTMGELLIENTTDSNEHSINLEGYSTGVYIINVMKGSHVERFQVIKN